MIANGCAVALFGILVFCVWYFWPEEKKEAQ
jgi:hypothetical protein